MLATRCSLPAAEILLLKRLPTLGCGRAAVVESRSGAVAARPFRFHSPLIKPDVQISRIRLSDQGRFMLSPTGGWPLARIGRTLTQAHRLSADKRRKKDAESIKYAG